MAVYYNENNSTAVVWLRELIKQGHIANGIVDERSIEDVKPSDLQGYTQCHFFAGIGGWSYALRQAGWSDNKSIWTGSCPCQPFSKAGKKVGFADERHLWPAFHHLIKECHPSIIFGEQVAAKSGESWFDLIQNDMEGEDYSCGMVVFPACSVGSPHLRKRLYWVAEKLADSGSIGSRRLSDCKWEKISPIGGRSEIKRMANHTINTNRPFNGESKKNDGQKESVGRCSVFSVMVDSNCDGLQELGSKQQTNRVGQYIKEKFTNPNPTNGFWKNVDWLFCQDRKWRPVEPGTSPLAYGLTARMGRLCGYGNSIVVPQAQAFIEAYCESLGIRRKVKKCLEKLNQGLS